ncbi:MAG: ABC-type transport auxiliary lipoprotein family protein [Rhodospirillaceae bacterium]|nr:ABC-type transport auxiliary lipoprotein family protein [Rhodospirillaceae bacterium]
MKKTLSAMTIAVSLTSLVALNACATAQSVPQDNFYRLAPQPETSQQGGILQDATVEVARFVADGSVSNRPILYSSDANPNSVSEYHYHFWIEAPPTLIKDSLVSYLRAAGIANRVVTPEMRVSSDYSVLGRIKRLEIYTGKKYTGVASFEIGLRRNSDGELLVLNEYESKVEANNNSVGSVITAVEKATEDIFARFVHDISAK